MATLGITTGLFGPGAEILSRGPAGPFLIDRGRSAALTSGAHALPRRRTLQSTRRPRLPGSILAGALFLYGVAVQSYWALALPVGALLLFILGLVFWVGWTIATVQVAAEEDPPGGGGGPGAATVPDPDSRSEPSTTER